MTPNPSNYEHVIVSYSDGKDSLACVLHLLEAGFRPEQMELWHQSIDGKVMQGPGLMDWPISEGYARATSQALNIPLRFQWRDGGFEGEMLRDNAPTGAVYFERRNGTPFTSDTIKLESTRSSNGTRLQFPQVSGDLSVRWCSAYLKIDVAARAINNDPRFLHSSTLFVTGERREESAQRAKYLEFEPHRCHTKKRHVDHYRPVIDYPESRVWNLIRRHGIRPHPAYRVGFSRVSCMCCIFGNENQWATIEKIAKQRFDRIAGYEVRFGKTIHRTQPVVTRAGRGVPYEGAFDDALVALALGHDYPVSDFFVPKGEEWRLPIGAFKQDGGPI